MSVVEAFVFPAQEPPQFLKKRSENEGANENLSCGFPPILLRELLRELWFSCCSSREMPFREWNFVFREENFEFRELLQEYPGTEIGVVPRLLSLGSGRNGR